MKLEDLRKDDLGEIYAWFPQKGNDESSRLLITYPDYATKAFYLSCQNIEQLEKSKNLINQGNTTIIAVGFWFIAIEAYINTLLKFACLIENKDFKEFKNKNINDHLLKLFELAQIDKVNFYKLGILPRFEEFKTFRNEIFHDRVFNSEVTFRKTKFSSIPYLANQVDIIQASVIALEIFEAFRFVYAGLDLMPCIHVQKGDSFAFVKYDNLYKKVLSPFFNEVLKKHNLSTDLNFEPVEKINLAESPIASRGEIEIIIRAIAREEFNQPANNTQTEIGTNLFNQIRESIVLDVDNEFRVPCYYATK
ncbi:MAG: hypothetical protein AN488_05355 [Anabaena sp. WA113]|nr:MAG: hypothetical protein AN488_05355 [Anabaena sp. WA113]